MSNSESAISQDVDGDRPAGTAPPAVAPAVRLSPSSSTSPASGGATTYTPSVEQRAEASVGVRADLHDARLRVLSEAGRLLAQSLDYEETLRSIVRLAVPAVADWASYSVAVPGSPFVRTIAIHHRDPELRAQAEAIGQRYPILSDNPHGVARVLRSGESELLAEVSDELLATVAHDADHLAVLRGIGFRSIAHVPILSRGTVIGALGFGTAESGRRYDGHDLALFEELASRAALAIENAKLYAAERAAREDAERAREEAERQRLEAHEAVRQMRALQQVTVALGDVTAPEHAARVIVEQAMRTLDAQAGSVVALDASGRTFHTLHSAGYGELADAFSSYPLTPGRPTSDTVLHLRPQFIESAEELERRYPYAAEVLAGRGFEGYAAVPILTGERVLAVLSLSFQQARIFDAADRAFVTAIAEACAQALTRVELYQAERRARAQAEQANAVKTDFLAVMSHELRTPLNAIIGYTDLLSLGISGPLVATQREHIGRVKGSATHLLTLIDEILTFAKLDAGRDDVELTNVDALAVARDAADLILPLVQARGLQLAVRGGEVETEPLVLATDAPKLRQILLNLLSNAVKFTEAGSVVLAVERVNGAIEFVVRDTGIGIEPENLERIFEPFWQVEQRRTRRITGTGLGLSVARRLAHLLGGTLTVASTPGSGSAFTLALPV